MGSEDFPRVQRCQGRSEPREAKGRKLCGTSHLQSESRGYCGLFCCVIGRLFKVEFPSIKFWLKFFF